MEKGVFNYSLNKTTEEFFLYEYFGILAKDYSDEIKKDSRPSAIGKCVRRAYLDMNRTLEINKEEAPFYESIGKELAEKLAENKSVTELRKDAYSVFFDNDGKVKESVGKLLKSKTISDPKKRKGEVFYYGHAQKWINMSLKYMWLIGLINEYSELEPPIDRFIMKGAPASVKFPKDNGSSVWANYSEGTSMPWSKLNKVEYDAIQKNIQESINTGKYPCPILWECDTWILQAEIEKRKQND